MIKCFIDSEFDGHKTTDYFRWQEVEKMNSLIIALQSSISGKQVGESIDIETVSQGVSGFRVPDDGIISVSAFNVLLSFGILDVYDTNGSIRSNNASGHTWSTSGLTLAITTPITHDEPVYAGEIVKTSGMTTVKYSQYI